MAKPELDVSVDISDMVSALSARGAILVRNAYDRSTMIEMRDIIIQAFATRASAAERNELTGEDSRLHTRRSYRLVGLVHEGATFVDTIASLLMRQLASAYLNREATVAPYSYVRWLTPSDNDPVHLPYHQDQTITGKPLLNIWAPFDRCGRDAPSLEVLLDSHGDLLPTVNVGETVSKFEIEAESLQLTTSRYEAWRPLFEPGDAMVFTGRTIHRTARSPGMDKDRISVELRLE